ncbi:MAG: Trk system potassium transporter TrkA [Gammaproteobacteria bacterium]|nr:Trk system potassium transporter TrkA [Gammaproteobacteria bacterium]
MKIIILGGNQVGGALAEQLEKEGNDITVVDINAERLRNLSNRLDISTVTGPASYPSVLRKAGAENADMLIAVTESDEVNIVACQVAYSLFNTPSKIARLRASEYLVRKELFSHENIPIDVCISPERLITQSVIRLIEHPGTLQVVDFAQGKVRMISLLARTEGILIDKTLEEIPQFFNGDIMRIVEIHRNNRSIILNGKTRIAVNDEVFFIADKQHANYILEAFGLPQTPYKRIMIAGGGNIGYRLAESLEARYQVKLLESDNKRAEHIANELSNTIVLRANASDKALLIDENIENMDVFCAVTNDDETNIMSCLQAKKLGAKQTMALITKTAYADLIEDSGIDIAISPQHATIGSILRHIRRGDVVNVHSLRRGAAEAIEVVAHGDEKTSKIVGKMISEIKLPTGANISAIVRDKQTLICHYDTVIEANDHLLLFIPDKKHTHAIEKLFQVSATFL